MNKSITKKIKFKIIKECFMNDNIKYNLIIS